MTKSFSTRTSKTRERTGSSTQDRNDRNPNPSLDVKAEETYRKPGQIGYKITAALKPTAPVGIIHDTIVVETNDPAAPLFSIIVTGQVQPELIVTPSNLAMGTVKPG